jgi:hypothetical protein
MTTLVGDKFFIRPLCASTCPNLPTTRKQIPLPRMSMLPFFAPWCMRLSWRTCSYALQGYFGSWA